MSSVSKQNENNRPNQFTVLPEMVLRLGLSLFLSLVLLCGLCPYAWAVEDKPANTEANTQADAQARAQTAAATATAAMTAPAARTALETQLDKYQAALDNKTLSDVEFQKLAELAGQNPTNARVHLLCGRGYDALGMPDEAVEHYKLADQYGPKDPEAIAAIINHVISSGGGEAANVLINSALKRFPDSPEILFIIGKRLKEKRHWAQASKVLVGIYTSPSRKKRIPGLPSELGDLILKQDPQKAFLLAKEELAAEPDFLPANLLLAKAQMTFGNYQLARAPLQKVFDQVPTNQESTEMYLRSLYWCGDYKAALEPAFYCLLNDSQAVVSELPSATTLANVFAHVPAADAATALQNFYEKTERAKLTVYPPFHFFVGRIFYREHRLAEAKAELLRYQDTDPKSAETLWMLGSISQNHDRDYVAALKYYRLAHALLPYNAAVTGACLSLEERMADLHNDWAWCLRDWLYATLAGKH